jgi:hypothetical protein
MVNFWFFLDYKIFYFFCIQFFFNNIKVILSVSLTKKMVRILLNHI